MAGVQEAARVWTLDARFRVAARRHWRASRFLRLAAVRTTGTRLRPAARVAVIGWRLAGRRAATLKTPPGRTAASTAGRATPRPLIASRRRVTAGDDVALCAPGPQQGLQLHYGPSGSDDMARWVLDPGKESMECLFVRAPETEDLYIGQLIGRSRPGSHHLQLSYAAQADDGRPEGSVGPCGSIVATQFIAIAQTTELNVPDLATPRPRSAPDAGGLDFEGSSTRLDAGRMFELTVHFLNTGSEPMLKEAWVNLYYRSGPRSRECSSRSR